eukprot:6200955-Pleurochrysis_carterae.AAC.1
MALGRLVRFLVLGKRVKQQRGLDFGATSLKLDSPLQHGRQTRRRTREHSLCALLPKRLELGLLHPRKDGVERFGRENLFERARQHAVALQRRNYVDERARRVPPHHLDAVAKQLLKQWQAAAFVHDSRLSNAKTRDLCTCAGGKQYRDRAHLKVTENM